MDENTRNALHALDIFADTLTAVHGQNIVAREEVLNRKQRDKERKQDKAYQDKIRTEDIDIQKDRWEIEDKRYIDEQAYKKSKDKSEDEKYVQGVDYAMGRDDVSDARYEKEALIKAESKQKAELQYKNTLINSYGADNILLDSTGFPTVKTIEDGFDIKSTPEWQMYEAKQGIADSEKIKTVRLNALSNEFYDLKVKRDQEAKDLRTKYPKLNDEHITREFTDLGDYVEDMAINNNAAIQDDIDTLENDIKDLKQIGVDFQNQSTWYSENVDSYVGENAVIDPGEFETMLHDYTQYMQDEEIAQMIAGDTSGLIQTYLDNKPSTMVRKKATYDVKAEFDLNAQSAYEELQKTIGEYDDIDDQDTKDELMLSLDSSPTVQANMMEAAQIPGYEDFWDHLQKERDIAIENGTTPMMDKFIKFHPKLLNVIVENRIKSEKVMSEYNSITPADRDRVFTNFSRILDSIEGYGEESISKAFDEFEAAKSGLYHHDKDNINKLFESIEKHFNIDDMEDAYLNHLHSKYSTQIDSTKQATNEDLLSEMLEMPLPEGGPMTASLGEYSDVSIDPFSSGTHDPLAINKAQSEHQDFLLNQSLYSALGIDLDQGQADIIGFASEEASSVLWDISRGGDAYNTDEGIINQSKIDNWYNKGETSEDQFADFSARMKAGFGLNDYHIEDLWTDLQDNTFREKDLTPFIGKDRPKATGNIFLPGYNAGEIEELINPSPYGEML